MVSLDTSQTLLFNVGIDAFSICILLIVYISYKRNFMDSQDKWLLCRTELCVLLTLVTDIIMWTINGEPGLSMKIAGYADNMIYLAAQVFTLLAWLKYAYFRLFGKRMLRKAEVPAVLIPAGFMLACIVSTPLTGWCFYLDADNFYHRGVLSMPLSLLILGYLFFISCAALIRRKKEVLEERKRECLVLAFFVVPPFLGGILQTFLYGCSILYPTATLSILLIYINVENLAISLDPLTGLNNRGRLDRYLHSTLESGQEKNVSLIMMDLNNFKAINDLYGHEVGDEALIRLANLLKNTFSRPSAFLSRYGGDEFVVVFTGSEEYAAGRAMDSLRQALEDFNASRVVPYRLSVSMGRAASSDPGVDSVSGLLKKADEQMYLEKRTYHHMENENAS